MRPAAQTLIPAPPREQSGLSRNACGRFSGGRRLNCLASGLALLAGLAILATAGGTPEQASSSGSFLVAPYLQWPTENAVTILWETDRPFPGAVDFGPTAELGRTVRALAQSALHEVRLTGLSPGTAYFYRVRSGPLTSAMARLRTAPRAGTRRWRLAVYGDSRSNPAMHRRIAALIAHSEPDLVLHTGDMVADGQNRPGWRREFFGPLEPFAGSIPWASVLGNHENDASNYFAYVSLPGNERFFALDYASAHLICLDSNAWIERTRDSEQFRWLTTDLRRQRDSIWTFVVFHHPLFSAHATRPINPLRWQWAPILLDPANHIDAVFTGHDHFYARNFPMGFAGESPRAAVVCLTTAGGGATLYQAKARDYVARVQSVHHFTLFEFDGDQAHVSAIDETGHVFDRWILTKKPSLAQDFCAYEVEELKESLRNGLARLPPVPGEADTDARISTRLTAPTTFRVNVGGWLRWHAPPSWHVESMTKRFSLRPGQPLEIPLRAEVGPGPFEETPGLIIEFDDGAFRNRTIDLHPFKLGGPSRVVVGPARPANREGVASRAWDGIPSYGLLASRPNGGRSDQVQFLADAQSLHVRAQLSTSAKSVPVRPTSEERVGGPLVLFREHFRVIVHDAERHLTFAITPEQARHASTGGRASAGWHASASPAANGWAAEVTIPRRLLGSPSALRINVVHHQTKSRDAADYELCPAYGLGGNADVIPDWRSGDTAGRAARLILPPG